MCVCVCIFHPIPGDVCLKGSGTTGNYTFPFCAVAPITNKGEPEVNLSVRETLSFRGVVGECGRNTISAYSLLPTPGTDGFGPQQIRNVHGLWGLTP